MFPESSEKKVRYSGTRFRIRRLNRSSSSIRITALKTYWVGPIVYVKVETNHGVSGWGDLKGVDPRPAKVLAESLFELLDGENPTRIEHLW